MWGRTNCNAWGQFNVRFYIVALIFLLFEVELIFLFPWAVVFGQKELIEGTGGSWAIFAMIEMFVFVAILALGLIYAWKKGFLDWVKPSAKLPEYKGSVPMQVYEQFNQKTTASKTE